MLLLSKNIYKYILGIALVFSTSANAGLYGFSETNALPPSPKIDVPPRHIFNYRKAMRDLVISLSEYGKSRNKNFQTIIHEGQYLLNKSMWEYHRDNYNKIRNQSSFVEDTTFLADDITETEEDYAYINKYISLIDGIVINNLYCDNQPASSIISDKKIPLFSIEQCSDNSEIDDAISQSLIDKNVIYPFINKEQAFRHSHNQLIINENANNITDSTNAKNISLILTSSLFNNRQEMIEDIRNSNYDIIIINPIFHEKTPFRPEEVHSMKFKKNGARRLIIAIYNISEISPNNYLWQKKWNTELPDWILSPSQVKDTSYIVK